MTPSVLGMEMQVAVYAIEGQIGTAGALRLQEIVIRHIKMRPLKDKVAVWTYPMEKGEGGVGQTIVMPLVESLSIVATDSWSEHDGFYLIIASCRPFGIGSLARWLRRKGWKIIDYGRVQVSFLREKKSWLRRLLGR